MAKIGLAAELAKQAAQAAREEVAALSGEAPVKASAPAAGQWKVPVLAEGFLLDEAMERATLRVAGHYRQALAPQGVDVGLESVTVSDEAAAAEMPQDVPHLQASLREQVSGRLIKAYTTPALLTMFAAQQQATGLVVDGQV